MSFPRITRPKGSSLLEVLIAASLLTVAFLAVVGLFSQNLKLQSRSAEMTECAEIGRRILEQLKANEGIIPSPTVTFDKNSVQIPGPPPFPPDPFPFVQGEHGLYEITINIEEATPLYLKSVEVVVSWEGGHGVSLQTFFSE